MIAVPGLKEQPRILRTKEGVKKIGNKKRIKKSTS